MQLSKLKSADLDNSIAKTALESATPRLCPESRN